MVKYIEDMLIVTVRHPILVSRNCQANIIKKCEDQIILISDWNTANLVSGCPIVTPREYMIHVWVYSQKYMNITVRMILKKYIWTSPRVIIKLIWTSQGNFGSFELYNYTDRYATSNRLDTLIKVYNNVIL